MNKKTLTSLKLISLCNGLVFYAPVSLLLRTSRGISMDEFFLLQIILYATICIFEIPCGFITDKIGYRRSIIVSALLLLFARMQFIYADNFLIFSMEAIIEGISTCFISGTLSAYLYHYLKGDQIDQVFAKMDNFGTAGFIISTLSFTILYKYFGLLALVLLTLFFNIIAFLCSIQLDNTPLDKKEKNKTEPIYFKLFKDYRFWYFSLISSVVSIGFIVVNYFFIVKLSDIKLDIEWISWIILGYSLIQMTIPKLLDVLHSKKCTAIIPFSILFSGILFISLFFLKNNIIVICCLLFVPTSIMMPTYVASKIENIYIDKIDAEHHRASILSTFNMGSNIISIVSLILFNIFTDASGLQSFLIVGILYLIFALLSFFVQLEKHFD